MTSPILIMAGGTGGHVFPALAVARELRGRNEHVVWLGTRHGLENEIVPPEGIPLEQTRVAGLRGKGLVSWLLAPIKLSIALFDALRVVRRRNPKLVLGMGGFASGPGGFAAWLLRKPLIIHEQNSVAGLTNRLLAGLAREVLEAFPGSFSSRVQALVVGNPVRPEIARIADPAQRFAGREGPLRLLVVGGSLGAKILNETVPAAVALMPAALQPQILHQAGRTTLQVAEMSYARAGVDARIVPFIDDVAEAYAWADLVVCRAGALTISELAAAGLGAVLVPFPSAVDDHQTGNARFLVTADAALLIPQSELTPQRLLQALEAFACDRELVLKRAQRARSLARPDATQDVVERCLAIGCAT